MRYGGLNRVYDACDSISLGFERERAGVAGLELLEEFAEYMSEISLYLILENVVG